MIKQHNQIDKNCLNLCLYIFNIFIILDFSKIEANKMDIENEENVVSNDTEEMVVVNDNEEIIVTNEKMVIEDCFVNIICERL